MDPLPAEPLGKSKNTGVGSLSLLQQIFQTQASNWSLLHCRWILYQLSYQGSLGMHTKSLRLCPTLCHPMDCSPPGSSVDGILQARIRESVAMPSSRGSSQPRDQTRVSHIAGGSPTLQVDLPHCTRVSYIAGGSFTVWATRESVMLNSFQTLLMACEIWNMTNTKKACSCSTFLHIPSWLLKYCNIFYLISQWSWPSFSGYNF